MKSESSEVAQGRDPWKPCFFKDSYITYRVGWSTKHEGRLSHLQLVKLYIYPLNGDAERIQKRESDWFSCLENRSKKNRIFDSKIW